MPGSVLNTVRALLKTLLSLLILATLTDSNAADTFKMKARGIPPVLSECNNLRLRSKRAECRCSIFHVEHLHIVIVCAVHSFQ